MFLLFGKNECSLHKIVFLYIALDLSCLCNYSSVHSNEIKEFDLTVHKIFVHRFVPFKGSLKTPITNYKLMTPENAM